MFFLMIQACAATAVMICFSLIQNRTVKKRENNWDTFQEAGKGFCIQKSGGGN